MAVPRRTQPSVNASMPEIARIGRLFAERRVTLRLTQQAVADLAGVSRSSLQSLERGSGSIKFGSVLEIADVLGLHIKVSETAE
ncbi:helix-turn-helix domain-containing protein [Mycolicibacterium sp. 050232]|uniref:helix-turn-helix domain-containing protein n=1 Tax=Mycolicibacterium sp. 050232 TaxID=3113982 RepID=UPI002E2D49CF|nr:helix-turn-helix domain-containing protein [Mycolicibacterium sp. 050232]MED5811161.1 helix-turn-helix domain-containing protein [Mycolicibacterium sp. 050232]